MPARARTTLLTLVVLVAAGAVGMVVANELQQHVPVVGGVRGCERLDGTVRQTECVADLFADRIAAKAANAPAGERADIAIAVVTSADRAAADDTALAGICHQAMHRVGRGEGERAAAAGSVPEFPPDSTRVCTAGYVHGLAEGYLAQSQHPDVAAVFPKLCHDPAAVGGCAHGIGHALVRESSSSAPGHVAESLDGCATLPNEDRLSDCANGVFMELAMRAPKLDTGDYRQLCGVQPTELAAGSCWSYLSLSARMSGQSDAATLRMCTAAGRHAGGCLVEYGRTVEPADADRCSVLDASLARWCFDGVLGSALRSRHLTATEAHDICRTTGARRDVCDTVVDRATERSPAPA